MDQPATSSNKWVIVLVVVAIVMVLACAGMCVVSFALLGWVSYREAPRIDHMPQIREETIRPGDLEQLRNLPDLNGPGANPEMTPEEFERRTKILEDAFNKIDSPAPAAPPATEPPHENGKPEP